MTRRDEVLKLLAGPEATQASVAAELGISQQRVSALVRGCTTSRRAQPVVQPSAAANSCTTPGGADPVVQPQPASTSAAVVQPPVFVQPDLAALREQIHAEEAAKLRAAWEPRWNAKCAEARQAVAKCAELAAALDRIAELEAQLESAPPAAGRSCRVHGTALVPVCPRCAGVDPDA